MKPLKKIGIGVLADFESKGILFSVKTDKFNIAAVKIAEYIKEELR
jgi:hypothetical protein